jgi:hypothetical protein
MKLSTLVRETLKLYCFLVVVGMTLIAGRNLHARPASWRIGGLFKPPPADYVASRRLSEAHRVVPGDLEVPRELAVGQQLGLPPKELLSGLYTRSDVSKGWPVRGAELAVDPCSQPAEGCTAIAVPIDDEVAKRLDVGWTVDLETEHGCAIRAAKVLAIDNIGGAGVPNVAVLELTSDQRASLDAADKLSTLQIVVRTPRLETH